MPRKMWWLGHDPWPAETGIKGLKSKASRNGGWGRAANETYSDVQRGGLIMPVTVSSCSHSPKDPTMWGSLMCAEVRLRRSTQNGVPQRDWKLLACILEENPFPLGTNIHKAPSFDSLWPKGNP